MITSKIAFCIHTGESRYPATSPPGCRIRSGMDEMMTGCRIRFGMELLVALMMLR